MKKDDKKYTNLQNMVILSEDELMESEKEAFSAIIKNPAVTWAKFILTDDKPNGNKQRVPESEFDNIIKTGVYMPVKMAFAEIEETHNNSFPLGVITHLQKVGNTIKAIAAFWSRERPDDINMLKEYMASKKPLNVSWEILYKDTEEEEDGVTSLKDTVLRAVTIVGMPAYKGRTPILAIAAKGSKALADKLKDEDFLLVNSEKRLFPFRNENGEIEASLLSEAIADIESYTELEEDERKALLARVNTIATEFTESIIDKEDVTLETIEKLKEEKATLEEQLSTLKAQVAERDATIATRDADISANAALISEKDNELASLQEFKSNIESEQAKVEKIESIKTKFAEAGIKKEDAYFDNEDNITRLLGLEESALDFMIQELVSFSESGASIEDLEDEKGGNKIPKVAGEVTGKPTLKQMVEFLKEKERE